MQDLRFGIVGWGYWGPKIARNLGSLPQATLKMVADSDARRLASLAGGQPETSTTTEVEELFRSDVDAVVIATPVRTHYQLAREALLHGKHVLVEKPLTASVEEAEELVALAEEQGRALMVGHTFRLQPCGERAAQPDSKRRAGQDLQHRNGALESRAFPPGYQRHLGSRPTRYLYLALPACKPGTLVPRLY